MKRSTVLQVEMVGGRIMPGVFLERLLLVRVPWWYPICLLHVFIPLVMRPYDDPHFPHSVAPARSHSGRRRPGFGVSLLAVAPDWTKCPSTKYFDFSSDRSLRNLTILTLLPLVRRPSSLSILERGPLRVL